MDHAATNSTGQTRTIRSVLATVPFPPDKVEILRKAGVKLLEPVMDVEVTTPDEYMGDVIGDLNSRRGKVEGMTQRGNSQVIRAQVPMSEMFGYATDLRSKTQGRATYSMQFHSYQDVPESISEEIVASRRGQS